MCYRLVERYSVCRCLYHKNSVDMCAAATQAGHTVQERTILVGYLCSRHQGEQDRGRASRQSLQGRESRLRIPIVRDTLEGSSRTHLSNKIITQGLDGVGLENGTSFLRLRLNLGQQGEFAIVEKFQNSSNLEEHCDSDNKSYHSADAITTKGTSREGDGPSAPLQTQSRTSTTSLEANYTDDGDGDNGSDSDKCVDVWSEGEGSSASNSTAPDVDMASAELVSLLVQHDRLKNLYPVAITALGPDDFRQSMRQILKAFGRALKAEAKQPQELQSGALVWALSRRVAQAAIAFHDPSVPYAHVDFRRDNLRRQKKGAAALLEDYLSSREKQGHDQNQREDLGEFPDEMSDDSDQEDADNPLPNLSKVAAFMTGGPAFDKLCVDIQGLSQRLSDQTSNCEGPTAYNCFPNKMTRRYQAYKSILKSKFWPNFNTQTTRVRWICDCGVMLYEDYATTDPLVVEKLSALLNNTPVTATESAVIRSSPSSQSASAQSESIERVGSSSSSLAESSSSDGGPSCLGCSSQHCGRCAKRLSGKFLALCVNTGRFHNTLGEIDVTNIYRDSDTFRMIKDRYIEVRGFRARARRLFLFQPNSVHFVKLNVEDTFRADIVEKPSIPPKEEVIAKRYEYSPLDLPLPPITSNSFLHYLENPECDSLKRTSRWLGCLPKRLEEQLVSRRRCCKPDTIVTGWGIHIEEGLNEEALACIALIILVCSGLLGLMYSLKMGDVSGGFTVAGYIATVLGVGISMLCFRWRQG